MRDTPHPVEGTEIPYLAAVQHSSTDGDIAAVWRWDLEGEGPPVTNELEPVPGTWDDRTYHRGVFASREAAVAAVRNAFPKARL